MGQARIGRIYQNQPTGNHWLKVRLEGNGTTINRSAIGAQVRVTAGATIRSRQVEAGTGQGNQNDMTLHFGLGNWTAQIDVEIFWPDGATENIYNVEVDQVIDQDTPSGQPPDACCFDDDSCQNPAAIPLHRRQRNPLGSRYGLRGGIMRGNDRDRCERRSGIGPRREMINAINGSGIDESGCFHTDHLSGPSPSFATMGFNQSTNLGDRWAGGTGMRYWTEFAFDQESALEENISSQIGRITVSRTDNARCSSKNLR